MRKKYTGSSIFSAIVSRNRFQYAAILILCFFYLSSKSGNVIQQERYSGTSQLASGTWIRVAVSEAGICKLTYEDLQSMQFPVSGLASNGIRVHGYGGMLPESAGAPRFDDLPEIPVMMFDGGDGSFSPGDYFLFYSSGPNSWRYNAQAAAYEFLPNIYSDNAFYFITFGSMPGKRLLPAMQPQTASQQVHYYNYRDVLNQELVSLIKSGRGWYGDLFDIITERDYTFNAFSTKPESQLKLRFSAVARAASGSSFTLTVNGVSYNLPISPVSSDFNTNFAFISTSRFTQPAPAEFSVANVKYNKLSSMDMGWLNFIEINAEAALQYRGMPMHFRSNSVSGDVEYIIGGLTSDFMLWDVTDRITPAFINANVRDGSVHFFASADTVREYFLSSSAGFIKPSFVEAVANQNLHGMATPGMIIIAPGVFMDEAVRLATFHANHDDISVSVVSAQSVYNEFSSGAQDISAIRDFLKMLWHKAEPSNLPRYVLLFGDASYDFKSRIPDNTNFVPTYQSPESLHPVNSLATDDFFVCIDDNEGGNSSDVVDIGIGRLPVGSPEEAARAVDKIIHYVMETEKVNGDWRNTITFVADDGDGNIHMSQADQIGTMIDTVYRNYNVDKIFLDAYKQESTAAGQRSPDANTALNQRVAKGSLIINYTGHGGESGWTHEQILEVKDIVEWSNYDRLPVFMTATCEFSRYDDPERPSGGEYAFLNQNGGAIALFTTARPTYGTPNFSLARNFYDIALKPMGGTMPRLGDIIRVAKRQTGADNNNKKFILLGDPAMKMAYPQFNIVTTSISDNNEGVETDTLSALQEVTIKGYIENSDNTKVTDFNGMIMTTVYDKQSNIITFGSDGAAPMSFSLWRNIIYKGRAEVKNGEFAFSFIVPRDIAYNYGEGKISYYATDGSRDASGNLSEITVGGFADDFLDDSEGPMATLFINDSSFVEGGFTDENPVLLAYLTDSSGINTIGNSIGHDIVAILDGNSQYPWILNDYYLADLNTYKSGSIRFPMFNLDPGPHSITLRIWDINNNSTEVTTRFVVAPENQLVLSDLEAWPNPSADNVEFAIGHNQAGKELKADLSVFTLSGQKVAGLNTSLMPEGYRTKVFRWDGRGGGGKPVSPGFYIANLRIQTPEGYISDKSVKIVITR